MADQKTGPVPPGHAMARAVILLVLLVLVLAALLSDGFAGVLAWTRDQGLDIIGAIWSPLLDSGDPAAAG